jgi:RNA polymerase sigma factor (sigma-70 family)
VSTFEVVPSDLSPFPKSQPASLMDVVISDQLLSRRIHTVAARVEMNAMHELAQLLADGAPGLLKRLAQMAIELCDAGSGGISMIEATNDGELFRWNALVGELEKYEGGSTPRDWSPCGQCLKAARPMLYSYPARFFTYFQEVETPIVEGLVIPMYLDSQPIGTIWIISHDERSFDAEDVRIMTSLGNFVSAALRLSANRVIGSTKTGKDGVGAVWAELVCRIAAGDSFALAALIDETRPVVFAQALRLLGLRADAEEVTMDVYSQVWRKAGCYDPARGSVVAWLGNMARSRSIDLLRSRARQQRSSEVLALEFRNSSDLEDETASSEVRRRMNQALDALPSEQRRVIELAYFNGYSVTEVAARLGVPLGTAKSRVRYGLKRLRLLMAAAEVYPSPFSNKVTPPRKLAG